MNAAVLVRQAGHGLLVTHGKSRGKMFGFLLLQLFLGSKIVADIKSQFVCLLIFNRRRKEVRLDFLTVQEGKSLDKQQKYTHRSYTQPNPTFFIFN